MFPDYLEGAKVLEYTEAGHYGFLEDYDENEVPFQREVRYLALCRYSGDDSYYIFSCDADFNVICDNCFHSPEICKTCIPESSGAVWHKKDSPYLYTASERKAMGGTLYFEFQRGRFRGKHWLDRSVYMSAELFDWLNLFELFLKALPHFDYYYVTEVTPAQYETLRNLALAEGGEIAAFIRELDHWVRDCFLTETVFTIRGI